jgi:putative transposase
MRKIVFSEGEYYHIYNRGTDKRLIFNNKHDKDRFLKLLYLCNGRNYFHFSDLTKGQEYNFDRGEKLVDIVAYCLLDNHFHLILKEISEKGISTFMHKLGISYTMYFNKLNNRKGSLFETNFGAKHLSDNNYLKYTVAYVHLNPIKIIDPNWKEEGIKDLDKAQSFLNDYFYFSYHDFLGKERVESLIVTPDSLPEYFESKQEFKENIKDWLTYSPRD